MANNSKRTRPSRPIRQQARFDPQRGSKPPEMIELVDPAWILKALGGVLGFALFCAFLTLSILFWRSQWQLVLHPSRTVTGTPATLHLPFQGVDFGVDAVGHPQLDGWFIPSRSAASAPTALVLHSGDGSMSDALPAAQLLHDANLNVLLFDYRGYGKSGGKHPTEASMQADADAALNYLTSTRSLPISSIVVYGTGTGGSLAVHLATQYPLLPALILQSPDGDYAARAKHDPRSSMVPFSMLFNQNFALATPLHNLRTPVLMLSRSDDPSGIHQAIASFLHSYISASATAQP